VVAARLELLRRSEGLAGSLAAALVLAAPAAWTFVSVARYLGIRRALGADHFDPDVDEPRPSWCLRVRALGP
jgi:hypothetical protein